MSDGQTLFLVLAVLYLSDCVVWIGRRAVLFTASWGGRWRHHFAGDIAGNSRGSLRLLTPLPPLGRACRVYWSPVSLAPQGVCDLNPHRTTPGTQTGRAAAYDQIKEVGHDEHHVLLNDARFTTCTTTHEAAALAKLITTLCRTPPKDREQRIRADLAARFSRPAAAARWEQVNAETARVRLTSNIFFVLLFGVIPLLATLFGVLRVIIPAAAAMLLMAAIIAVQYTRAHRRLYSQQKSERLANVIKMILCPPLAIRATDLLTLEALAAFHPVVAGGLLLGNNVAPFLAKVAREVEHPLPHKFTDPLATAVVAWAANAEREAVAAYLSAETAVAHADLLAPPAWDGVATAYCPRCAGQFLQETGNCPDCRGIPLRPLSPTPQPERT